MRLTRYTDYSMRVLLYLGGRPDQLCSIGEIAQAFDISHNHLMKVVHELGRAGLVASVRGRFGGIRLARPAAEINIGDVVRQTEPDFDLVDCGNCRIQPVCVLSCVLQEAIGAFLAVLGRYSLADLVRNPGPMNALLMLKPDAARPIRSGH
jgi:Rrf2 family nitric oxide-sensitive transcriptional repressor